MRREMRGLRLWMRIMGKLSLFPSLGMRRMTQSRAFIERRQLSPEAKRDFELRESRGELILTPHQRINRRHRQMGLPPHP